MVAEGQGAVKPALDSKSSARATAGSHAARGRWWKRRRTAVEVPHGNSRSKSRLSFRVSLFAGRKPWRPPSKHVDLPTPVTTGFGYEHTRHRYASMLSNIMTVIKDRTNRMRESPSTQEDACGAGDPMEGSWTQEDLALYESEIGIPVDEDSACETSGVLEPAIYTPSDTTDEGEDMTWFMTQCGLSIAQLTARYSCACIQIFGISTDIFYADASVTRAMSRTSPRPT